LGEGGDGAAGGAAPACGRLPPHRGGRAGGPAVRGVGQARAGRRVEGEAWPGRPAGRRLRAVREAPYPGRSVTVTIEGGIAGAEVMAEIVTLEIPDELARRGRALAAAPPGQRDD